jgi:hypothetical protein
LAGTIAVFMLFLLSFREGKEELPQMLQARKASYQIHCLLRVASDYRPLTQGQEFRKLSEMVERENLQIYLHKVL